MQKYAPRMPISGSGKKILQQVMYFKLKAVSRQRPAFVPHSGRRLDLIYDSAQQDSAAPASPVFVDLALRSG